MPRSKRVTIADIARQAGVSPGAVSFALNGRPGVSEETRQRILAIADQHDWRPSSTARALVGARAGVIGFAVNRPARTLGSEAFFTDLIAGVQSSLAGRRIGMQLAVVPSIDDEMDTYRRWRRANQVDGVLVLDPRIDDPRHELFSSLGLPAIMIGGEPSTNEGPATIWLDDTEAARTVFGFLFELGHRRIVYVSGPSEHEHVRLRGGVLQAMSPQGVAGEIIETDYSPAQVTAAVHALLDRGERPSAIVFDNDVMAIAGLRVAQQTGVRVPEQLSVASFDDSAVTSLVHPSITCLTRDTFGFGEQAAVFLLDQIEASGTLPDRTGPPLTLTVRESTDRVPS